MGSSLRLLGSRILVKPLPPPAPSGMIVTLDRYAPQPQVWEVVQVGPKARTLAAGDKVFTHEFPSNLHVFTDNYRILNEDDVLMKWP